MMNWLLTDESIKSSFSPLYIVVDNNTFVGENNTSKRNLKHLYNYFIITRALPYVNITLAHNKKILSQYPRISRDMAIRFWIVIFGLVWIWKQVYPDLNLINSWMGFLNPNST